MYTSEMQKAVRSLECPADFITIYDNEFFLSIVIDPHKFAGLDHDTKMRGIVYLAKVKEVLESLGANIMLEREAI